MEFVKGGGRHDLTTAFFLKIRRQRTGVCFSVALCNCFLVVFVVKYLDLKINMQTPIGPANDPTAVAPESLGEEMAETTPNVDTLSPMVHQVTEAASGIVDRVDQDDRTKAFQELLTYEKLYPALGQAVLLDCRGRRELFDENGTFRAAHQKPDDVADILYGLVEDTIYYKRHQDNSDFQQSLDEDLDAVVQILRSEPEALHPHKGSAAYHLRQKLSLLQGVFSADPFPDKTTQAIENLAPHNIRHIKSGNYNAVYQIDCPGLESYLIAVRMPHPNQPEAPRLYSYNTQFDTHTQIYNAMEAAQKKNKEKTYAKIPRPYFETELGPQVECLAMEHVKGSVQLADFLRVGKHKHLIPEIRSILENTIQLWRNEGGGKKLFEHNDLHTGNVLIRTKEGPSGIELEGVYIIDFDFAQYKPLDMEEPRVVGSSYVKVSDDGILKDIDKMMSGGYAA